MILAKDGEGISWRNCGVVSYIMAIYLYLLEHSEVCSGKPISQKCSWHNPYLGVDVLCIMESSSEHSVHGREVLCA